MIGMQCPTCRHYLGDSRCRAYPPPAEIPSEFLTGEHNHDKPVRGQVDGYVYDCDPEWERRER